MAALDPVTGCAANVLGEAFCSLWKKVVQEVKMVISLPQAVTDMEKEVETLVNEIQDINAELRQQQRGPIRQVKTWLEKASQAIEDSQSIRNEYQTCQQHKICFGCCPNCASRYRISKNIRDWKLNVIELLDKRLKFPPRGEYGDPIPPTHIPIQNPKFAGDGTQAALSDLERWLTEDSNIRRIGIHGMGGVGKTLLLGAINDSEKVKNAFEFTIKVTVSKNRILDLQSCIADRLNLEDFPDKSNFEGRKYKLRSYLRNRKFLLLLEDMWADDMWTSDEVQNLGVSLNDTGFKIVLTTRDKQVCARMNVQKTKKLEPLLEDDGWQLFRSRAFQNQNGDVPHEIEEVAREIAKECKGLPLAIIVVAAAMIHHAGLSEWKTALHQMQNVPETFYDLHPGVDKKLFQRLKWSYNVLPDYVKICFLYFAVYPEDRVIDCEDVIAMWITENLVEGSEDGYDIGDSYIQYLRDRCLIEVVSDNTGRIKLVKMHDILRDLAIRIAQNEHKCYFKAGQGISHFPVEKVDGKGCARMSLMYNHLDSLPTTFSCSSLSVLLLAENPGIKEVPASFLRELSLLRVLDLSSTGITFLPETIGDLKDLQILKVSDCKNLEYLPERIIELKRMRVLDTSGSFKLRHLPRGISELVSLEILSMYGSIRLNFEEDANADRKNACLKDLQILSRLSVFSGDMQSTMKEGVMRNWSKMRELILSCANQGYLPQDMKAMKDLECLWLLNCDVERLPSWIRDVRKLGRVVLESFQQLKDLPAELRELPCLKVLLLYRCDKLEELELEMGFPKLEELRLEWLESLECVRAEEKQQVEVEVEVEGWERGRHRYPCSTDSTWGIVRN